MNFLSLVPRILLILLALSFAGVSCTEPSRSEKIERGGSSERVESLDLGGPSISLKAQKCDDERSVLDLSAVVANIQTGDLANVSARMTTTNTRLLKSSSAPLTGAFTMAADVYQLRAILAVSLFYEAGRAFDVAQKEILLGLVNQDGCKTVSMKADLEDRSTDATEVFNINLDKSNERQLTLQNAKGDIRVYQVLTNTVLQIKTYQKTNEVFCDSKPGDFIIETTSRLNLAESAQMGVSVSLNFLKLIDSNMDFTSNLKNQIKVAKSASKTPAFETAETNLLLFDVDYIDLANRFKSDNLSGTDNLRLPACPKGTAATTLPAPPVADAPATEPPVAEAPATEEPTMNEPLAPQ